MAAKCPRCRGGYVGRGKTRRPCPACNSTAGGVGDKVTGAGQRLADRIRGRRLDVTGRTTTSRDHRLGTETVRTRAPRKKPVAKKKATAALPPSPGMVCDTCKRGGGHLIMTGKGLFHSGDCPTED
ncbi:hypothetical protein AB1484_29315 [Parafrankia sp. FMc6]|uniref:hypothetical protein n=1 Tax=Parafrankia soli TaxID=2599596 RepID=UPI0034D5C558